MRQAQVIQDACPCLWNLVNGIVKRVDSKCPVVKNRNGKVTRAREVVELNRRKQGTFPLWIDSAQQSKKPGPIWDTVLAGNCVGRLG
jgi:hypothetical protein